MLIYEFDVNINIHTLSLKEQGWIEMIVDVWTIPDLN